MAPAPDPDVRRRLLEAAADLLGEEGPRALSVRRLAADAGTSTMAVYTHFGGMPALVRAVVAEGFERLHARVAAVELGDDAVANLAAMAAAYRAHALANPHMYAVMFGSASLGEYRLQGDELAVGLAAFQQLVDAVALAMDQGVLRRDDPNAVAGQIWVALHGYVMLELAGYHSVVEDPEEQLLHPLLANLLAALGA
ncbi:MULTISPECIES: TetR/AcrR family transcriptional regulator [unclassified Nocardioides]|uniref:TetR/AcrR family transcriptional regulator n=1 Tax=unclassified Nocardioides TaxID=2615069 RepID=UPI0036177358